MRNSFNVIYLILGLLLLTSKAHAQDQNFSGIYEGSMHLTFPDSLVPRDIPLQVSLVLTGKTTQDPDGDVTQVIDGSFLIDGEGGAFPFIDVDFDFFNGRLEMTYIRPGTDIGDRTPGSFTLRGRYSNSDASVKGEVHSSNRGPLGTFELKRTQKTTFATTAKYTGYWQGLARFPDGGEVPMSLQLLNAEGSTVNPLELEFGYTPGKLAHVRWNNLRFSISHVTIDYLRGVVTLRKLSSVGASSELSIEFSIDPLTRNAAGVIKSGYRGEIARFNLPAGQFSHP
jgi:hypothetical protein